MIEQDRKRDVKLVDKVDDLRLDLIAGDAVHQYPTLSVGLPNTGFNV